MKSKSQTITSDSLINSRQTDLLRALLDAMIPRDASSGLPTGSDPKILSRVLEVLNTGRVETLRTALNALESLAMHMFRDGFVSLTMKRRMEIFAHWEQSHTTQAQAISSALLHCYYTDERVMHAHGMEPRPPFPKGFSIPQGDWTLLDPVKQRERFWRDAPQ